MANRDRRTDDFLTMLEGLTGWQRFTITLRIIYMFAREFVISPTKITAGALASVIAGFVSAWRGDIIRMMIITTVTILWLWTLANLTK